MKKHRRVVISGGFGFLGSAIIRALSENGFSCAVLYRSGTSEDAEAVLAGLPGEGHTAWQVDFSKPETIPPHMQKIAQAVGPFDALVHSAEPRLTRKTLLDTTREEFAHRLDASVLGAFEFLRAGAGCMPAGGDIFAITTEGVVNGSVPRKMGAYLPAKFALHGILQVFRSELEPKGIRVHEIAPGFLPGGLNSDLPSVFLSARSENSESPESIAQRIVSLLP